MRLHHRQPPLVQLKSADVEPSQKPELPSALWPCSARGAAQHKIQAAEHGEDQGTQSSERGHPNIADVFESIAVFPARSVRPNDLGQWPWRPGARDHLRPQKG